MTTTNRMVRLLIWTGALFVLATGLSYVLDLPGAPQQAGFAVVCPYFFVGMWRAVRQHKESWQRALSASTAALEQRGFRAQCSLLSVNADVLVAVDGAGLVALCEIDPVGVVVAHLGEHSAFRSSSDRGSLRVTYRGREYEIALPSHPSDLPLSIADLEKDRAARQWWCGVIDGTKPVASYPITATIASVSRGPLAEAAARDALRRLDSSLPEARVSSRHGRP